MRRPVYQGPLIGKIVLDFYDYSVLFQLSAVTIAAAMVPSILLHNQGRPLKIISENIEKHSVSFVQVAREFTRYPVIGSVLLYYAVTFGVVLSIYPAYMRDSSITDQEIEMLFFVFGISRFATLFVVQKISIHGISSLVLGVSLTAVAMLITFAYSSILSFALALILIGFATSIFYPVTLNIVTRGIPKEKMGSRLGIYETIFGIGWTAGPIAVGISSDAFGVNSPYLSFFVIGIVLSSAIALSQRYKPKPASQKVN